MKKILFFLVIILAGGIVGMVYVQTANAGDCEFKVCDIFCCQKLIKEHQSIIDYQEWRLDPKNKEFMDENDAVLRGDFRKSIADLEERIINLQELIALNIEILKRAVCR